MSREVLANMDDDVPGHGGVALSDAKKLPFPDAFFERVLMFDVVEHLHPWELHLALLEVKRVLKPGGKLVVPTAPNIWYDKYAYPVVRTVRTLMGEGDNYPANPRQFLVDVNEHVHVNEQSLFSMYQTLARAGFSAKVWLDSPPQNRTENMVLAGLRYLAFKTVPLRWFFDREVFAVASKP
jgi:SAM-dependent methyltransferase